MRKVGISEPKHLMILVTAWHLGIIFWRYMCQPSRWVMEIPCILQKVGWIFSYMIFSRWVESIFFSVRPVVLDPTNETDGWTKIPTRPQQNQWRKGITRNTICLSQYHHPKNHRISKLVANENPKESCKKQSQPPLFLEGPGWFLGHDFFGGRKTPEKKNGQSNMRSSFFRAPKRFFCSRYVR